MLAQSSPVLGSTGPVTWAKVMNVVYYLLQNILFLAGLAVVGAVVYYGVLMATASGSSDQFTKGRKGLIYSVVGALIIFGVYTIIATIRGAVNSIGH